MKPLSTSRLATLGLLAGVGVAAALALAPGAKAAAEEADANCSVAHNTSHLGVRRHAQTFSAKRGGRLTRAQVDVLSFAAGTDFVIAIRGMAGVFPSATVLASASIPDQPVTGSTPRTIGASFANPPTVVAGQQYAISVEVATGQDFSPSIRDPGGCEGILFFDATASDAYFPGPSTWDMIFATFVTPPDAAPQPGPSPPLTVGDGIAPRFTGKSPSASPNPFAVNLAGKAEANVKGSARKRKAAKKGTTFGYSLSEAATVTFTIQRKGTGRKVGKKCKKPTRGNRKKKKCTRYTAVGAFRQQAAAGANSKPFSGRIGRKTLRPGRYRALLRATDAAGNRSAQRALGFRVVRAGTRR